MPTARPCDVAVIGIACRFPGASTSDIFWNNLINGVESVTVFSEEELLLAGADRQLIHDPHYVKAAPILVDYDGFDAAFFGYSPGEARLMDPQHRLFLEVAWEAFEAAGYDPFGDNGVVGVYAGAGGLVSSYMVHHDHPELRGQTGDLGHIANDRDFLPSRVAFKLNLTGPSINVQTACSTSLVAVHLACRALLDGEADMVLAGASVVRVPQIRGYLAEPGGIYSVDGHCRAFDANASGTLFGSGVAAVLLKPLQAALAARDQVYAVIRGTAVTNDGGQKLNYTASTVTAQARAMTEAMTRAGVEPDSIGYIECHGTGTTLGDPLEVQALTRAFRRQTQNVEFCPIGSVKSNLGHLEQCAGLAGLIKTILALRHGMIPPSLHFRAPNPRIPFARSPFFVNTQLRPFEGGRTPRRAGVNAVGMGGTNAFAVLEEAPESEKQNVSEPGVVALALSAKSKQALSAQLANFRAALAAENPPELRDVCFTTNRGRPKFEHRFCAVGADRSEIVRALERALNSGERRASGRHISRREPITFLFSGQGTQYLCMGKTLYSAEPKFRHALNQCFELFEASGISLAGVMFGDNEARLTRTFYAQPALFSLQIALTELWNEWGITPDTVIGHSIGEFAAAVAAGACSLEDAARLVSTRARLMEELGEPGGMASIGSGFDTVCALVSTHYNEISVAADNAPDRTVVSGNAKALASLVADFRELGISVSELKTSHAFHSPLMEPMLEAFEATAATVSFRAPQVRWISTLTGQEMTAPDASYWRNQIRYPVRFRQAIETAAQMPDGAAGTFLEIGPGTALISLGRRCLAQKNSDTSAGTWLCSITREDDERRRTLEGLGTFFLQGRAINWQAIEPKDGRRVPLPTYPFLHQRFWLPTPRADNGLVSDLASRSATRPHPFLGERLGGEDTCFEALLSLERYGFLKDHRVFQYSVLPMAAILDAITVAGESLGFLRPVVADFVYEHALTLAEDRPLWTQLVLEPTTGSAPFRFESTGLGAGDPWKLHASGILRDDAEPVTLPPFPSHTVRSGREVSPTRFYRVLHHSGLSYGPAFRGIHELWCDGGQAFAKVALPAELNDDAVSQSAFLDACLHVYAALVGEHGQFESDHPVEVYVPVGIDAFYLYQPMAKRAWVHAIVLDKQDHDNTHIELDIRVYGEDGQPLALFRGLRVRHTSEQIFAATEGPSWQHLLYSLHWQEAPHREPSPLPAKHWWVFCDATGVGERLGEVLAAEGCSHALLRPETFVPEDLFAEVPQSSMGLVYLRALDALPIGIGAPECTAEVNAHLCGECLDLIHALDRVRDRFSDPPRLWLVTRGVQGGLDCQALIDPVQSPLWGLGRTFALEYPEMWGGLIDLPIGAEPGHAADMLLRELKAGKEEDQVSLRAGKRWAPRLKPFSWSEQQGGTRPDTDATYWIVGGLGRLGLRVSEALVSAGARHLVVSGRRPPGKHAARVLESLRRQAQVVVHPADVSRQADIENVLAQIRQSMPPLRGVIHAAAVFEDAVLANARSGMFDRVLQPKMSGAWLLHCATQDLKLDFFILFSSVLSLWGASGQGAYAAANSFLDALAAYRRAQGLPATVFNWGPWDDPGNRERWGNVGAALWKQRGTAALSADTCLNILLSLLCNSPVQVAVTDTRWPEFLAQFAETPPLFRDLAPAAKLDPIASDTNNVRSSIEEIIAAQARQVLGLNGQIDLETPLNELGLDSLLAVTLGNRLRQALNVIVPTASLLRGPSISALAGELFPELARQPACAVRHEGKVARIHGNGWLLVHRPSPEAKVRLFSFPFAGGGAGTFRKWPEYLDPSIELVAIEPPGRQTRVNEAPIHDIGEFLRSLLPELLPLLDKPFAVYGHCLGALTSFETVRTLTREHGIAPVHVFVSGARPPDELHQHQDFEINLMERLVKLPSYDLFQPVYHQSDEVFSEAILQFNVLATEDLVKDPELRPLLLPSIRAEFEMSSNYRYRPGPPWDVPITCLTGIHDTYVSAENARSWSRFTSQRFQLFLRESEHFMVVDDDQFLLRVINHELTRPL